MRAGRDPALIRQLHRLAIRDLYPCAGKFRANPVYIGGVIHQPPPHDQVQWLVQDMCDLANSRVEWPPLRTAAFLLWRLNWIHPFSGGNGRTSRAVSYFALSVRLGIRIPGTQTIPELIHTNRQGYYDALQLADAPEREGRLELGAMESYLQGLLAAQLMSTPDAESQADLLAAIMDAATTPPGPT